MSDTLMSATQHNVSHLIVKYAPIDKFVPCKQNKKLWGKSRQENPQLTEFIRESGDIDPLLVCKNGNKLEILSGESRYHSAIALKMAQLPYKQIEVVDLKDKLKHVVIRNLGHACSNGKAVRAVTQYLLMTGPSGSETDATRQSRIAETDATRQRRIAEFADPRVDETPEPAEPLESIKQRVEEIIGALKFENSEKWVREVTRLYLRAINRQNINRIIEGASKAADESGLDGLEASNNKADEQVGIKKEKKEDSAQQGADCSKPLNLKGEVTPAYNLDATQLRVASHESLLQEKESLLQQNESLRKKAKEDKEYGDSQGQVINTIEQAIMQFCEEAHIAARRQGKDIAPVVATFKLDALMSNLGLRYYIHPEQTAPEEFSQEEF